MQAFQCSCGGLTLLNGLGGFFGGGFFGGGAEHFCGFFGGDVALGHAEHFKTDHELADFGGAEERGVEVRVEGPLGVGLVVCRLLVEAHGVREGYVEEVIVDGGDELEDGGEAFGLLAGVRSVKRW